MSDYTQQLVDYILKNAGKLSAEKIEALGTVVKATVGTVPPEAPLPNDVPENDQSPMEEHPIDITQVKRVQIDEGDSFPVEFGLKEERG